MRNLMSLCLMASVCACAYSPAPPRMVAYGGSYQQTRAISPYNNLPPVPAQSGADIANELAIVKAATEAALGPGPKGYKFNGVHVTASTSEIPVPPGCTTQTVKYEANGVPYIGTRVLCPPGVPAH